YVLVWPGLRKSFCEPETGTNQLILLFSNVGSCVGSNANTSCVHPGGSVMFVAPCRSQFGAAVNDRIWTVLLLGLDSVKTHIKLVALFWITLVVRFRTCVVVVAVRVLDNVAGPPDAFAGWASARVRIPATETNAPIFIESAPRRTAIARSALPALLVRR